MANPNNAVGTNGAFGGRTSVNAFNDVLATFTGRGVIQGWTVTPSTGLKVNVGGQSGIRDVAIAEDNNGNRTTIDNISQAPIEITMPSAPSTGSRIDLIVGYVENPPQGSSTAIDNPAPTGIITVSGSSSSSPSAPTDSAIRTALTNAGINGATAYYAILGSITISSGTTDISANMINATPYTNLNTQNNIATGQITADKVDFATYMTAGMSSNVTIQTPSSTPPYNRITLNAIFSSRGDDFTLENGHIRCNFTGNVIMFGTVYEPIHTSNGISNVFIYKNSENIIAGRHNALADSSYVHIGPAVCTATCVPGDYFTLSGRYQSQTAVSVGSGIEGTKFTIIRLA